jgi:hypothetical protein
MVRAMTNDPSTDAALMDDGAEAGPVSTKPTAARVALQMLGGMAVGALVGIVGMKLLAPYLNAGAKAQMRHQLGAWALPVLIGSAVLAAYFGIVVHEVGHLIGGLMARFRFYLFVAGPLRVQRDLDSGRVSVGLNRSFSMAGGLAGMIPIGTDAMRRRLAMLVAGGPLASFALAAIAGALVSLGSLPLLARNACAVTAVISAALGLATLIPMRNGGFASDGARLLRLLRGGPAADREAATMPLVALSLAETPPREWPRDVVEKAVALRDGTPEECYASFLAYHHALDSGDVAMAARRMARVAALIPATPRASHPGLHLEAAFFAGAYQRDAASARRHLAAIPANAFGIRPYDRARAEAAAALAEGDLVRARGLAETALAGLPPRAAFRRESLTRALADTTRPVSA